MSVRGDGQPTGRLAPHLAAIVDAHRSVQADLNRYGETELLRDLCTCAVPPFVAVRSIVLVQLVWPDAARACRSAERPQRHTLAEWLRFATAHAEEAGDRVIDAAHVTWALLDANVADNAVYKELVGRGINVAFLQRVMRVDSRRGLQPDQIIWSPAARPLRAEDFSEDVIPAWPATRSGLQRKAVMMDRLLTARQRQLLRETQIVLGVGPRDEDELARWRVEFLMDPGRTLRVLAYKARN